MSIHLCVCLWVWVQMYTPQHACEGQRTICGCQRFSTLCVLKIELRSSCLVASKRLYLLSILRAPLLCFKWVCVCEHVNCADASRGQKMILDLLELELR